MKIDVPRDWELHHLEGTNGDDEKASTLSSNLRLTKVCEEGDLNIVRAMVERTQVDLKAKSSDLTERG